MGPIYGAIKTIRLPQRRDFHGARQRRLAAAGPFAAGHLLAQAACGENHGL